MCENDNTNPLPTVYCSEKIRLARVMGTISDLQRQLWQFVNVPVDECDGIIENALDEIRQADDELTKLAHYIWRRGEKRDDIDVEEYTSTSRRIFDFQRELKIIQLSYYKHRRLLRLM